MYNTSTGNDTADRVYGLYMCLNYVTNETCHDCINTAQSAIVTLCPSSKEAVVWEEMCQLRYSDANFFGKLNVADNIPLANKKNISDPEKFESLVNETLRGLAKQAAYNLSAKMYATRDVPFEDKVVYALVQCTTDLSGDDCGQCLQKAIVDVLREFYFSIGARLLSRSCYVRYELYAFYDGATEASIPRDPNNNNGDGRGRKIWVITIVSACLAILLLGSCVCITKRRNQRGNIIASAKV
ncbi:hypothetical protein GBA52_028731 [Prunus armeniaca]|nr:hypothetical protein GBA52_028731 [Prunus armeniaca]